MESRILALLATTAYLISQASAVQHRQLTGSNGPCGSKYVVRVGETLDGIAFKCGVGADALRSANGNVDNKPPAGKALVIPSNTQPTCPDNTYILSCAALGDGLCGSSAYYTCVTLQECQSWYDKCLMWPDNADCPSCCFQCRDGAALWNLATFLNAAGESVGAVYCDPLSSRAG